MSDSTKLHLFVIVTVRQSDTKFKASSPRA